MGKIEARVTQILLDKYIVEDIHLQRQFEAIVSGNIKRKRDIVVGDIVFIEKKYDQYLIDNVKTRKNYLIRPPVANIDQLVIVIAIDHPSPDYLLLDKELIFCRQKNITPIICINKLDLADNNEVLIKEKEYILQVYQQYTVIETSVKTDQGMKELKKALMGKVSAFSGNSGVGKSSITQQLLSTTESIEIGEIGQKTNKGKHTTKYVKLYEIEKNTYLLDTPGFSSYELFDVDYKTLASFYDEFSVCHCDFENCSHVNEDENVCEVKRKVKQNKIDQKRYERYVYIYEDLKEKDRKKYK